MELAYTNSFLIILKGLRLCVAPCFLLVALVIDQYVIVSKLTDNFLYTMLDFITKTLILSSTIIVGVTWLVFFTIKTLVKYTDFGTNKKENKEKQAKIYGNSKEIAVEEELGFLGKKPKIETSFGDSRIGEINDNPSQAK